MDPSGTHGPEPITLTLDDRLKLLAGKPHLTDDEQLEEVRLKKEKLRLKDEMEALVRRHQAPVSTLPN